MISTASTFIAIDKIGLSISTGLLSGTSVIVSFSFGALVQGEAFSRTWLALFAILILVAAIIAYAAAGQLASTADQQADQGDVATSGSVDTLRANPYATQAVMETANVVAACLQMSIVAGANGLDYSEIVVCLACA